MVVIEWPIGPKSLLNPVKGHMNSYMGRPVTPVRDPLPKKFGARSASIFARSSNGDTCIFTCVPVATRWLFFFNQRSIFIH